MACLPQTSVVAMGRDPRVGRSVTMFGELPPNRAQTMTHTLSGASELAQLAHGGHHRWRPDP
jgi:hypothetical protein